MILHHFVFFSFLAGAGGTVPPVTPASGGTRIFRGTPRGTFRGA